MTVPDLDAKGRAAKAQRSLDEIERLVRYLRPCGDHLGIAAGLVFDAEAALRQALSRMPV